MIEQILCHNRESATSQSCKAPTSIPSLIMPAVLLITTSIENLVFDKFLELLRYWTGVGNGGYVSDMNMKYKFVWYRRVHNNFNTFIAHRLNHPVKRFKPSEARPPDPMRPSPYNRRSSTNDLYSYHLQQQNVASSPNNLSQPFIKQEIKQEAGCNMPVSCIFITRHVVWRLLFVHMQVKNTCIGIGYCPWHFHITLALLCGYNVRSFSDTDEF